MYSESSKFDHASTLIGDMSDYMANGEFVKLADCEGTYKPGEMNVKGWVMFKDNFAPENAKGLDKLNVYLVVLRNVPGEEATNEDGTRTLFIRLPKTLGIRLVEDFNNASVNGVTIEDYVSDIKRVRTYKTKYATTGATFEAFD